MFEKVQKLFNENSVKNCHFIYLKKNGNEFESNSISLGKSHWNNNQDLNGDYIFRLMSMSKPITALAAMQLVEKGKLNLDSPVEEVLPEIEDLTDEEYDELVEYVKGKWNYDEENLDWIVDTAIEAGRGLMMMINMQKS